MTESWEVDLRNTKNSTMLGDVGEAVALHYLCSHGFFLVTRPIKFLHGKFSLISAHYQIKPPKMERQHWLTDKQKEYLENFPSWDYIAFKLQGSPYTVEYEGKRYVRRWKNPYLVEVKTVRGTDSPHKNPTSNAVSEAKLLEFKLMLVVVRVLENWNMSVQATEL